MNIIKSDNVVMPNGQMLTDVVKTFAKDIDYARYLPISAYYINWGTFTGDASDTYTNFARPSVTKLAHHAPGILPEADSDGFLSLNRYYQYLFFLTSTVRVLNVASHQDFSNSVGLRLRDEDNSKNYDIGFKTINIPSYQVGNFDDYLSMPLLVTERDYDYKVRLLGKNIVGLASDLTYINTHGIVFAIPREGAI